MNGNNPLNIKNKEPTNKQLNFMFALLSEPTTTQAYIKTGISEKTAYKWLKDPIFQMHFKKLRLDFIKNTTAKLQANTTRAVDTLVNIMENDNLSALARVQSARTILEFAYKGVEIEDIQERLDRLEELEKDRLNKVNLENKTLIDL